MRPSEEVCLASLFTGASPDLKREVSGAYFNEKAVEAKPSAAALGVGEKERLEKWKHKLKRSLLSNQYIIIEEVPEVFRAVLSPPFSASRASLHGDISHQTDQHSFRYHSPARDSQ